MQDFQVAILWRGLVLDLGNLFNLCSANRRPQALLFNLTLTGNQGRLLAAFPCDNVWCWPCSNG